MHGRWVVRAGVGELFLARRKRLQGPVIGRMEDCCLQMGVLRIGYGRSARIGCWRFIVGRWRSRGRRTQSMRGTRSSHSFLRMSSGVWGERRAASGSMWCMGILRFVRCKRTRRERCGQLVLRRGRIWLWGRISVGLWLRRHLGPLVAADKARRPSLKRTSAAEVVPLTKRDYFNRLLTKAFYRASTCIMTGNLGRSVILGWSTMGKSGTKRRRQRWAMVASERVPSIQAKASPMHWREPPPKGK